MWFLKSEEGEDFGPVGRSELDEWHAEGRITAECQLLRQGSEQWQWASDVYPALDADDAAAEEAPTESALPAFADNAESEEPAAPVLKSKATASKASNNVAASKAVIKKSSELKRVAKKNAPPPDNEDDEQSEENGELSTRSKLIAGLLGIFLGPLGTHRFYLGYVGLGLAMLFTLGGCGVWSLVDAILIFTGRISDAEGLPLRD